MSDDRGEARAIQALVARLFPGARVTSIAALAPDARTAAKDATAKAAGYGLPRRIALVDANGAEQVLVLRTAAPDEFGHDRRSDRAQEMLLAFDTFACIPGHVRAIDVGAVAGGELVSLRQAGEFYLVTSWAPGRLYADDLRRVAREGTASSLDVARCETLARWLVALHREKIPRPAEYRRAIRDLVGHGEGIFGIVDAYPADVPAAPAARLHAIERRCVEWRWRQHGHEARLSRTHGDFHPFNVIFDRGTELQLLDASRGCEGDPADDVTAMAVNFVFFALEHPQSWAQGLGVLWRRFWQVYLGESGDAGLLAAAPPFFAWRGLVLASPRFYPALPAPLRDKLLGLVERVVAARRLDPAMAEELFP